MKTLTTTIVGLSLLVGSALSAQDSFTSFYPVEDIDTPSYLVSNDKVVAHQTLAKSVINKDTLSAFFPVEDVDTPEFLRSNEGQGQSVVAQAIAKSGIEHCSLSAFYPVEDVDTRAHISC